MAKSLWTKFGKSGFGTRPVASRLTLSRLEDRDVPAVWTVTSLGDTGGFMGVAGQIRGILMNPTLADGDVINFAVEGVINLNPGNFGLKVNQDVEINGPGSDKLTIQFPATQGLDSVIVTGKNSIITLKGLTISGGIGQGGTLSRKGGGIYNSANTKLTIQDCVIANNGVTGNPFFTNIAEGRGGGIYNDQGHLVIEDSIITGNSAIINGIYDQLMLPDFQYTEGGGIHSNGGSLTIRDSIISNNAVGGGDEWDLSRGEGGGIYSNGSTVIITGSKIQGNSASARHITAGAGIRLIGSTATIQHSQIIDNYGKGLFPAPGWGTANHAEGEVKGVGISTGGANTTIEFTTIANNKADSCEIIDGVGISTIDAPMAIRNSTISGNSGVTAVAENAGGRAYGGGITNFNTMIIENSTIANNSVSGTPHPMFDIVGGGAIKNSHTLTLRNCTITGNSSNEAGGAIFQHPNPGNPQYTAHIINTIIAGNTASISGPNFSASISSQGHNLVGDPTGINGGPGLVVSDMTNVDPMFDPLGLQDNGGPTKTIAVLPMSKAINGGTTVVGLTTDQRGAGFSRHVGSAPDIGAFEVQSAGSAKVDLVTIGAGVQRSMVTSIKIDFNEMVTFTGSPAAAFQLSRQSDGASIGLNAVQIGNSVTLTFTGALAENGSLPDGRFTLTILAANVNNGNFDGNGDGTAGDNYALVGTPANGLFRLFGDADGNGTVNPLDFATFRSAYGGASTMFDYDNSGTLNAADFAQFRARFGVSV